MAGLKLTMALSHYDRHIPFFDGSAKAEGVDLQVLEVGQSEPLRHGRDQHERMLQKGEFDISELSLSSYLMAKSRGMPFTPIPVFPRRLFSLSQMWVNVDAKIDSPNDLIGKRVGLSTSRQLFPFLPGEICSRSTMFRGATCIGSFQKKKQCRSSVRKEYISSLSPPAKKSARCWNKVKSMR
jgi:hypothetical protein